MKAINLLHDASIEEIKKGYTEQDEGYTCLLCGKQIEKGIIYTENGIMYEAEKFMKLHIKHKHGSVFDFLVSMDKKITGISEHQSKMLGLFYQGKTDGEVQAEMGIGSSSTIRNHRFVLKEKEHQAKIFLTLMQLLKEKNSVPGNKKTSGLIEPHSTAKMVDDRYGITEDENEKVIKKYFEDNGEGKLKIFDMKEKYKIAVLRQIIKRFDKNKIYSEKDINEVLKNIYEDFATIRRYLIEYGFLDRKLDCSEYWVASEKSDENIEEGENKMKRESANKRKELIEQWKETEVQAGVYQIRNTKNDKVLVLSTPNLKTMNGKRVSLETGSYKNKELQQEWKEFGEEAFEFEVLEVLKVKKDGFFDKTEELKKLEEKWLEKIEPYDERGYNKRGQLH